MLRFEITDAAVHSMDDTADFGVLDVQKTNGADLRPLAGDLIPFERTSSWSEPEDTCGW